LSDTPVLWVLRDNLGLTGTKFGCGVAQCGACTVLLDARPLRSCSLPVSGLGNGEITTIEGLSGREGEAVRSAWIARDVPQCGYCQSGQIMSAGPTDQAVLGQVPDQRPTRRTALKGAAGIGALVATAIVLATEQSSAQTQRASSPASELRPVTSFAGITDQRAPATAISRRSIALCGEMSKVLRSPGGRRTPAPGAQAQFGELAKAWAQTGAHCPRA